MAWPDYAEAYREALLIDLWLGLIMLSLTGKPYWLTYDLAWLHWCLQGSLTDQLMTAWLHWGLQGSLTDWLTTWLMAWPDYAEAYMEALLIDLRLDLWLSLITLRPTGRPYLLTISCILTKVFKQGKCQAALIPRCKFWIPERTVKHANAFSDTKEKKEIWMEKKGFTRSIDWLANVIFY